VSRLSPSDVIRPLAPTLNDDLVSVIIPMRNAGKWIELCLKGILGQTHANLEIFCIDDCSSDDSYERVVRRFGADGRLGVVRLKRRVGPYQIKNWALATMVLRRDGDAVRKGAVEVDRARIVRRLLGAPSKAPGPLEVLAFAGVQVLDPRVAPFLPEVGCIVRTLYRGLVDEDGGRLGAFVDDGPWTDIGSPEGYLRANLEVAGEGVLADVSAVVEAGARVGPSVVLGPGARVLAGAVVRRAVVWPDTVVGGDLEEAVATPFATLTCRATAPRSR